MKIKLRTLFILSVFALFVSGFNTSYGQVSCDGSMTVTPAIGNWGSGTQLGDGSGGNIEICISNNNLLGAGASCGGNSQFVLSTGNGSGIVVIWNQTTVNGTCITISTGGSGFAWIALNCELAGATCDITWTTVDGGGASVCGTCSDGILNNGETAIDCGGPNCVACPSCSDGILNNGETSIDCGGPNCPSCHCTNGVMDVDETGIDCGGADCFPCSSCFDGIQNGTETGVDCGGTCALDCSTNSVPVTSACGPCPAAAVATVYPTNCDQVGTSAYNLNSPTVNMVSCGSSTTPVPAPPCASIGSQGTWIHVDLAPGVTQVQLAFNTGSVSSGSSNTYAAAYQGTDCGSLTAVPGGCQNSVSFISSVYGVYQNFFTGLDPTQDLWIFMFNDSGKAFNLNYNLIGTTGPPSNTSCATSSTAIGSACNLGASGAAFTTPGAGAGNICDGGTWGSNENTTFYSFTADATTGSLIIDNIICNDGTAGNAQFAVWTSCAAIGTYSAPDFLGCAVGTGAITLSPLTVGQTYYIAADGFAGDNCTWAFSGTGILLPIKLISFYGNHTGKEVELFWSTATERNNDYFTIQRTLDGKSFEDIGFTPGAGTSTSTIDYSFIDFAPYKGTSYYRIKQTDYDGKFEYSELISVRSDKEGLKLVKTVNLMGQEVNMNYSGMVIDIYDDGSTVKRMKN